MNKYKKEKKIIISASVDEAVIKKARKLNLNVSAICNDALKKATREPQ